jgi:hypothetical protein
MSEADTKSRRSADAERPAASGYSAPNGKEGGSVLERLRRVVVSLGWLAAVAIAVSAGWKNH